ncbi:MAG: S41 family peptidase [Bacteroidales bacterium]
MRFRIQITILLLALVFPAGAQSVIKLGQEKPQQEKSLEKFERALDVINRYYVDTVDNQKMVEQAIISMLKQLDPHSNYFTAEQIKRANEDLEGTFEGVGVEFQIIEDTPTVMIINPDGPAERGGILQGDQILRIGGEASTGSSITTGWVSRKVRGDKGSEVVFTVVREGEKEPLQITVIRDKIPTYSVNSWFMLNENTGYIKISRFMRTTVPEFEEALRELKKQNMDGLILDLRGNTGGLLKSAVQLADHFLGKDKVIVYTEGLNHQRLDYKTTGKGLYRKGRLVVLIDENTASASEIVTGAIQDWDRGIVMGSRSFGKGLVQKPYSLPDGSAIRLTIARYHTPVGRCIQRPYEQGRERYYEEMNEKIRLGVYSDADSMNLHDSLRYQTPGGRIVYGGGGIMPDIFVAADTSGNSELLTSLHRSNMFNRYALYMVRHHKDSLLGLYPGVEDFLALKGNATPLLEDFSWFAAGYEIAPDEKMLAHSGPSIERQVMSSLGRLLYGNKASWQIQGIYDPLVKQAIGVIAEEESSRLFKVSQQTE